MIATGGLSFPDLGANGIGHHIARQFGLRVTPLGPGLVPFEFNRTDMKIFGTLSGLSLPVRVDCRGIRVSGGYALYPSGSQRSCNFPDHPPIGRQGDVLKIDLLPASDALEIFRARQGEQDRNAESPCRIISRNALPAPGLNCICLKASLPVHEKKLIEWPLQLHSWEIRPKATQGYRKAEVTLGGVDTDELSSKTMEVKKVPGLYFAGEVHRCNRTTRWL